MIEEMKQIVQEVWPYIGIGRIPKVETKRGGYTAVYYPRSHVIRFRENSWDRLNLANRRLLVIHECYHATGHKHSVKNGIYLSSFDLLSITFYKHIYGDDGVFARAQLEVAEYAEEILKYVKSLKPNEK